MNYTICSSWRVDGEGGVLDEFGRRTMFDQAFEIDHQAGTAQSSRKGPNTNSTSGLKRSHRAGFALATEGYEMQEIS